MATLYAPLRASIASIATTHSAAPARKSTKTSKTKPRAEPDIHAAVAHAWAEASKGGVPRTDVLRSTLDLVGRDVALRPVVEGELPEPLFDAPEAEKAAFVAALEQRLDIVLALYETVFASAQDAAALEPGAIFIPLLEEFVELLSVETWHELFGYFETRGPRFCKDMPVSKGKALPLLRTINAFLRLLSHTPQDLRLRGRVQLFASASIGVADKSAINMRGEYAALPTTWEEAVPVTEGVKEEGGDVKMEDAEEKPTFEKEKAQPDFYSTLWSLQQYFAHPPSLGGPAAGDPAQTPFDVFRAKSDFVLSRLYEQTRRERVLLGKNPERSRKRPREDDAAYPRYLTARNLLEYELTDVSFRRQVLVQYFILFQFLLNLTPDKVSKQLYTGMPKTFVIEGDNETWVRRTVQSIRDELRRMGLDGPQFEATVVELIARERRYAQWKNDGCPEAPWQITPVPVAEAVKAAESWKRHCRPMRRWPFRLGTPNLTRAWESRYTSLDDFRSPAPLPGVFELEDELRRIEADEEDDKAMGRDPPPELAQRKRTIKWCALREARRTHPRVVAAMNTSYDLHQLVEDIRKWDARKRKARNGEAGGEAGGDGEGNGDAEGDDEVVEAEGEGDAEAEVEGDAEAEAQQDKDKDGEKDQGGEEPDEGIEVDEGRGEEAKGADKEGDEDKEEGDAGEDAGGDAEGDAEGDARARSPSKPASKSGAENGSVSPAKAATPLDSATPEAAAPAGDVEMADA